MGSSQGSPIYPIAPRCPQALRRLKHQALWLLSCVPKLWTGQCGQQRHGFPREVSVLIAGTRTQGGILVFLSFAATLPSSCPTLAWQMSLPALAAASLVLGLS